jgi:hypothetical protein
MEILISERRLYISFKSLVNDFVYSFGRAALLLLVEVQNHTVPIQERRRIRVKSCVYFDTACTRLHLPFCVDKHEQTPCTFFRSCYLLTWSGNEVPWP